MIDSNKATAIRTVVIVVFAWPVAFTSYQPLSSISKRTWILLVLSGPPGFPGSATFRLCNSQKLRKSPP